MSVDPRENSGINSRKVKAGSGRKIASVDPRENSGANGGKEGERGILRGGEPMEGSKWGEGVHPEGRLRRKRERKEERFAGEKMGQRVGPTERRRKSRGCEQANVESVDRQENSEVNGGEVGEVSVEPSSELKD